MAVTKLDGEERVLAALKTYDADACRPESGFGAERIAALVLRSHWDIASCFCPVCVLARAVLNPLVMTGEPE